jgi:ElaB/YqjD/DUF883 family membrane-anchored ribosome-binding protein
MSNSSNIVQPGSVQARRALYYPYIHPKDLEWVKGTLLAFGQINRVVPDGFPLRDLPEVSWLRDEMGPDGEPLICAVSPEWPDIEFAQARLFNVLMAVDKTQLTARFSRAATAEQFGFDNRFEIHEDKFHEGLLSWLGRGELAWPSPGPTERTGNWWGVHPVLGEAVTSVMAIAAARHKGLDIVTESVALHAALASLDEQQVLGELLSPFAPPAPPAVQPVQVVDQLGHIVMTTMLDLQQLSVKDVAEIVQHGDDLRRFREALSRIASDVPLDAAPAVREGMLRDRADIVVAEWEKHRKSMPKKLREALRDTTAEQSRKGLEKAGDAITQAMASGGAVGAATLFSGNSLHTAALSAGVGFAIGLVLTSGRKLFSKSPDDPFQYLSLVEKAGATLLTVPKPLRVTAQA